MKCISFKSRFFLTKNENLVSVKIIFRMSVRRQKEELGINRRAKYEKAELERFKNHEPSQPPPKIDRNWSNDER